MVEVNSVMSLVAISHWLLYEKFSLIFHIDIAEIPVNCR